MKALFEALCTWITTPRPSKPPSGPPTGLDYHEYQIGGGGETFLKVGNFNDGLINDVRDRKKINRRYYFFLNGFPWEILCDEDGTAHVVVGGKKMKFKQVALVKRA